MSILLALPNAGKRSQHATLADLLRYRLVLTLVPRTEAVKPK